MLLTRVPIIDLLSNVSTKNSICDASRSNQIPETDQITNRTWCRAGEGRWEEPERRGLKRSGAAGSSKETPSILY